MSRLVILSIRTAIVLFTVWLAFAVPRWIDSGFYDQCPSFNCFTSASSAILSLSIGLASGLILNIALTAWMRDRQLVD